jgi:hypothetical protein
MGSVLCALGCALLAECYAAQHNGGPGSCYSTVAAALVVLAEVGQWVEQ